ncbi:MAG: protein phosphatase 2C domain-containing protein [Treponema sp.]|jgi:hypothetical protein|nr:protein phosphatase 2C domain-containing protein [Treponema sp.]
MAYTSFPVTAAGISHTRQGKGCEDISLHYLPYEDTVKSLLSFTVVMDGYGDENYFRSAQGASFAAREGILTFADWLGPSKETAEASLRGLVEHILERWQGKIEKDYWARPVRAEKLVKVDKYYRKRYAKGEERYVPYGSTLIAATISGAYWFGIHIGDGRWSVLYEDGTFDQPVPWDERCYLNITSSLCDEDTAERARIYLAKTAEKPPAGIFSCSDGVDNNYPAAHNEAYLYALYSGITLSFAENGFAPACGQLEALARFFATHGKGDDTSIAGIIDRAAARRLALLLREAAGPQPDHPERPNTKKTFFAADALSGGHGP